MKKNLLAGLALASALALVAASRLAPLEPQGEESGTAPVCTATLNPFEAASTDEPANR